MHFAYPDFNAYLSNISFNFMQFFTANSRPVNINLNDEICLIILMKISVIIWII